MGRWLIWGALVIVWTLALEFPVADAEKLPAGELLITHKYMIGKTLHVSVYALLAALSAWVPVPGRFRFVMMFFLLTHAWGTERLQETLEPWCHRGGSLTDVGFDLIGIVTGTAASWRWWTGESADTAKLALLKVDEDRPRSRNQPDRPSDTGITDRLP